LEWVPVSDSIGHLSGLCGVDGLFLPFLVIGCERRSQYFVEDGVGKAFDEQIVRFFTTQHISGKPSQIFKLGNVLVDMRELRALLSLGVSVL
jgi:hypothetical protein